MCAQVWPEWRAMGLNCHMTNTPMHRSVWNSCVALLSGTTMTFGLTPGKTNLQQVTKSINANMKPAVADKPSVSCLRLHEKSGS